MAHRRHDVGTVTAEFAAGLPILVMMLAIALGAVSAVTTQLRCEYAAYVVARAAARDADTSAAAAVVPDGARLEVRDEGELMRATVTARVQILGTPLPAITVTATRHAVPEQAGPP